MNLKPPVIECAQNCEIKEIEERLKRLLHLYGERVKELNCLYEISELIEKPGLSLAEILQGIVELIPPAWQYLEITHARIIVENQEFKTENFRETRWELTSEINAYGKVIGSVGVYYSEEMPSSHEGPFLEEERRLLNFISKRVNGVIERHIAENKTQKPHTEDFLSEAVYENEIMLQVNLKISKLLLHYILRLCEQLDLRPDDFIQSALMFSLNELMGAIEHGEETYIY